MKKCLLVVNMFKSRSQKLAEEIKSFLEEKKVTVFEFDYDGTSSGAAQIQSFGESADFAITLGGDGTVLFACRFCSKRGIPVFPVNLGEFGFLASVSVADWKKNLEDFLEGKTKEGKRSLVEAEVIRNGKSVFKTTAMNDVVISSTAASRLINLNVAYNSALLGPFRANGIIVATATGSTAYSAAAGGPIIDPSLDALVLTPVNSFSLSARPLVFNSKGELAITVLNSREKIGLSADGQLNFDLQVLDVVILKISEKKASLVCSTQTQFYSALKSKLNWSGGPSA